MEFFRSRPVGTSLATAIVFTWCISAFMLGQSLFAAQNSMLLLDLGAADGTLFGEHQWWRILSSQFFHVHFFHMLFNAACILIIGGFIEQSFGWWKTLFLYFVGGSIALAASVIAYPDIVSSGASQALMSICGAAILILAPRRHKLFALVTILIQAGLDIHTAQKIKPGHSFGFGAGMLIGAALFLINHRQDIKSKLNESMR